MKTRNCWLCAATVLALGACDRIKDAAQKPAPAVKTAAAPMAAKLAPTAAAQSQKTAAATAPTGGRRAGAPPRKRTASLAAGKTGRAPGSASRRGAYAARTGADSGGGVMPGGPSMQQEASYSADYQACMAKANGFTVARADCHSAELARQGQRLTQAYDAAASRSGDRRERLEATQRDWTNERDAACRAQAGRGDADLLQEGSCRLDMTIRRANGLVREAG